MSYTNQPAKSIRIIDKNNISRRFYPISETNHYRPDYIYGFIVVNCEAIYGFKHKAGETFAEA